MYRREALTSDEVESLLDLRLCCCRYAPSVEEPVFHFHKLVHRDLVGQ